MYVGDDGFTCHSGSELARLFGYVSRAIRMQWLVGKSSLANHSMTVYELRVCRALDKLDR